jgi:hypothetical protein
MRFALAAVVLLFAATRAGADSRERMVRALDVVDELKLSDAAMSKLLPLVKAYDRDREALLAKDVELLAAIRVTQDSAAVDRLLDQRIAVQRQLLAKEQRLVGNLRVLLRPAQAARARVMLLGVDVVESAAAAPMPPPQPLPAQSPARTGINLFPPGSPIAVETLPDRTCDPFASMHGCR